MRPSSVTLLVSLALGLGVASAQASPCGNEIARLEKILAEHNLATGPTASQSVGAQLSRQPTAESVQKAEAEARSSFAASLERAKALDAQGKTAECADLVNKAKLNLGLR
jgi:hypothetical protein